MTSTIAELQAALEEMQAALQEMKDRADIIDVCIRNHWYTDRKRWDLLAECFAEEVTMPTRDIMRTLEPGQSGTGSVLPRETFVKNIASWMEELTTQHILAGHHVDLDGDTAVCHANGYNQHIGALQVGGNRVVHGTAYEWRLRRTPDGWRIVSLTGTPIWGEGNEAVCDVMIGKSG
jgi:hypothetical protein